MSYQARNVGYIAAIVRSHPEIFLDDLAQGLNGYTIPDLPPQFAHPGSHLLFADGFSDFYIFYGVPACSCEVIKNRLLQSV